MIWACPSFGNWRSLRSRQFPRTALTQSFLLKIKHLPSMKSSKKNIKFSNIKISKNDR